MTLAGTPILILKEGSERSKGRTAQRNNIMAARAVADAVQSTLGPRGMDKLLVDSLGDIVITNDGATILDEIEVQHPAAKMLVQVAKTQDDEVGDGTTSAVVLAGELLRRAEDLLEKKIHPTVIVHGYKMAAEKALKIVEELSKDVEDDQLVDIAGTALNSKAVGGSKDFLSQIAVEAIKCIEENGKANIDHVTVIQKQGRSIKETELIKGVVLDKEVVHDRMPKKIEGAKIALINAPLEIKKTEFDAKIRITDASQISAFMDQEYQMIKDLVTKVTDSGANVIFSQKGIEDEAQELLAKAGILAARRIKKSDMEKLTRATGAKIVTTLDDLSADDLGDAGRVEQRKIGDEKLIYVEDCQSPKAVSVILRGANKYFTDEAERAIHDALCVVRSAQVSKKYVAGAGATEIEISKHLRDYAPTVGGREALAVEAFADAVEIIPKTLSENGGLDSMDILIQLRERHAKGEQFTGVNILTGNVVDAINDGVIEPSNVKMQAIRSASEASELILRIDDVITARESAGPPGGPGGMPPGMGGMGGMGGMPGMM
ncbi:MAG: thermosome subunit beta [Candidatus Hodarchaeales archaeon]|jgi:thermosome